MIADFYEKLTLIDKTTISDGMGGFTEEYVEGAEFMGSVTTDNSMEARMAGQQGVRSLSTLTIPINAPVKYNDIIKVNSSGKYFRVTSEPDDIQTPKMSEVDFKQASCEPWSK